MKTIVCNKYGVLELQEIERPNLADDGVLVRVRATSINPADWYAMKGRPYIARPMMGLRTPKEKKMRIDFAGTVEAVGKQVTQFRIGNEVFGRSAEFAEYVCIREDEAVALKPAKVTFEEAAAVPVAALTALQGLRDHGQIQPGQHVLINGASGGVGTFAVQIAKALGAEVTGVCSTGNVDLALSLGADHVIDYTRQDFTRSDRRYDLMLDIAGSKSWSEARRVLTPQAVLVIIGASKGSALMGPLSHIIKVRLAASVSRQKAIFFIAKLNKAELLYLGALLESGKVKSIIDRRYELSDIGEAFRYLGEGHAQGKIVLNL